MPEADALLEYTAMMACKNSGSVHSELSPPPLSSPVPCNGYDHVSWDVSNSLSSRDLPQYIIELLSE